jgi:predicted GNAT superfamily acetyltransferase
VPPAQEKPRVIDDPTKVVVPNPLHIVRLSEVAEFDRCVELQLAVWRYREGDWIPRRMFILATRIGGQVIGAFHGSSMVGFVMALPGYRDGRAYLHSHMLAVLPEFRNCGLGRRLKLAQREEALQRGIELIEWTFDPLEVKNSYLNIARLGAIARRYRADCYGSSTSPLQGGLPTDRLCAEWWLRSSRVCRAVAGEAIGQPGSASGTQRIPIPGAVDQWKRDAEQRTLALELQADVRAAMQAAFRRGRVITGYQRSEDGDGCFLLTETSELHEIDAGR